MWNRGCSQYFHSIHESGDVGSSLFSIVIGLFSGMFVIGVVLGITISGGMFWNQLVYQVQVPCNQSRVVMLELFQVRVICTLVLSISFCVEFTVRSDMSSVV